MRRFYWTLRSSVARAQIVHPAHPQISVATPDHISNAKSLAFTYPRQFPRTDFSGVLTGIAFRKYGLRSSLSVWQSESDELLSERTDRDLPFRVGNPKVPKSILLFRSSVSRIADVLEKIFVTRNVLAFGH